MVRYSIVFATNEKYLPHTAVTIVSLLENNRGLKFKIYYIIDNVSDANKRKLISMVDRYECVIVFINVDASKLKNLVFSEHFNSAVYYRLMMAEVIEEEKILYLDSDIVVNDCIKGIFENNIDKYFLGAVVDPGFTRHGDLGMTRSSEYFNAGVMYVNLKKWREENVFEKCMNYLNNKSETIKLADQDVLNAIVDGSWKPMALKYNQQAVVFVPDFFKKYRFFSFEELRIAIEKPIIIHYTGSLKPWHYRGNHPYKSLYWKYRRMSPFKGWLWEDITVINIMKWCIPFWLKSILRKGTK